MHYKLLLFNCYGGCETGVAGSKAIIKIWEEYPNDVKIGCLPAIRIPFKFKNIMKTSDKRILVDACPIKCGKKLFESVNMPLDSYIELTSTLGIKKKKQLPSKDLEEKVYDVIKKEVDKLLSE
ncbi:MAG: hypothetical protein EU551_01530 [Promethearchaeota archaeon]|nr:MAG: hypothetical protein EU551_01530 [Candidatus Lokiarchaeota archaeon]